VAMCAVMFRKWIEWACIALAYAIAFFQRLAPQAITSAVMADIGLDLPEVALLSSTYFIGYAVMQLPAGPLVDRFGVRRISLLSMAASVSGSLGFSLSHTLSTACLFRLMIAGGDALVFTALIKLVAQRFPDNQFSLVAGLSQVAGFVGGGVATLPLAFAVSHVGWRITFGGVAALSSLNFVVGLIALARPLDRDASLRMYGIVASAVQAFGRFPEWGCIIAFASQFVVVTTISGVWGIPLISYVFQVEPLVASQALLAHLLGNIIGSAALGHVADRIVSLERALVLLCVGRSLLIVALLPASARAFGFEVITGDLFLLGVISGATIPIVLKCTNLVFTAERIGTGISLSATIAGIATAVVQPAVAAAMGWAANVGRAMPSSAAALTDTSYDILVVVLLLLSLVGGLSGPALLMRRHGISTRS
jgi:predicted MFS family arabinose efflux permease